MSTPLDRFLAMPFHKSRTELRPTGAVRIETRVDPYTGLKVTATIPLPKFVLPPYRGRQPRA